MNQNHNSRNGKGRPSAIDGCHHDDLLASMRTPTRGDGQKIGAVAEVNGGENAVGESKTTPPPARRGRPVVLDAELQEKVCLLLSVGLSRRQTAVYLDIVHSTIANAIEREPEFAARVQRAEQLSVIQPLLTIASASQKNWRAATWLMARNERRVPRSAEEQEEEDSQRRQELARLVASVKSVDLSSASSAKHE